MAVRRCEMDAKMESLGDTVTDPKVWKKLEEKIGYIAFFHHFHDNPLAGFPRTKSELPKKMMRMKHFFVNKAKKVEENGLGERKREKKPSGHEGPAGEKSTVKNVASSKVTNLEATVLAEDNSVKPVTKVVSSENKTPGDRVAEGSVIKSQATPGEAAPEMLAKETVQGESGLHGIAPEHFSGEKIQTKEIFYGPADTATSVEKKFIEEKPTNTNTVDTTDINENRVSDTSIPKNAANNQVDDAKANDGEKGNGEANQCADYSSNDNDNDGGEGKVLSSSSCGLLSQ